MANKNGRVVNYKKKRNINVGTVIFAIIFIYLISYVIMYINRDRISVYEVVYGKDSETSNKSYNALILRDENVVKTDSSGYLNLFIREGEKAAVDGNVFSIDESGKIMDLINGATNTENALTNKDLESIREKIVSYQSSYENVDFGDVYDFKGDIQASLNELINLKTIENMDDILGDNSTSNVFKIFKASTSGIVSYSIDGYENKNIDTLNKDSFNKSLYSRKKLRYC